MSLLDDQAQFYRVYFNRPDVLFRERNERDEKREDKCEIQTKFQDKKEVMGYSWALFEEGCEVLKNRIMKTEVGRD